VFIFFPASADGIKNNCFLERFWAE